jgi:hypothetical protein
MMGSMHEEPIVDSGFGEPEGLSAWPRDCEVEMMFKFGTRDKLMVVWELAAEKSPFIKELYDLRWRDGLQGIT